MLLQEITSITLIIKDREMEEIEPIEEAQDEELSNCCNAPVEHRFDPLNSFYGFTYRCSKCNALIEEDELLLIGN